MCCSTQRELVISQDVADVVRTKYGIVISDYNRDATGAMI